MHKITQALTRLFERHRIVFWYDAKQELRADFDALALPAVTKVELTNNEFGLKYRILRQEPEQRFLIYHEGPQPADLANWLLDVQLAQGEFRTDQTALWLAELELGLEFAALVQEHAEFFGAKTRREGLKRLLRKDDTPGLIRLKLLAICTSSEARLDAVLEQLLAEAADHRDEKLRLLNRCQLEGFLWQQMQRHYGYHSAAPSVRDFVIELFKSCYAMGTDGDIRLTGEALVFLKRWKDSRQFESAFETLSAQCADLLRMEQELAQRDFHDLLEIDYFRLIDQKIISELVRAVISRTVSSGNVAIWVRQRRQSHWYGEFSHLYEAIDVAAQFLQSMAEVQLTMHSLSDGIERYCRHWFRLDQLYRKFTYHVRSARMASLMESLTEQIENLYSNNYLLRVNDEWQRFVDETDQWQVPGVPLQREFFREWVQPFLQRDNKVCVVISDAMRYEVGDEFLSLIRQEDRYEAKLEPMLSMLPSYTQLGIAALLPNTELALADNESGTALVDGQSSQGKVNRIKLLNKKLPGRATALTAEELMALNKEESRTLFRDHDVVYVYHNRIDATGDKRDSEERVFEAVEETLQELIQLVKKLTNANASNLLVTADHGFLYQNRALEESDFASIDAEGEQILCRDRRFVLGKGLRANQSLRTFQSAQLGLAGAMEVQIPKSINRLRLKGSGSRFVHGGASLQEVVVPVIRINKKRQSDISAVAVEIIRSESSVITSGQLAVAFYQTEPVTEKVQARQLRAGIYTQAGELISDLHELPFDLTAVNPRERELQLRFLLTHQADAANGQEVVLRLEEKLAGTTHYRTYKEQRYQMRRSFTSDFDF